MARSGRYKRVFFAEYETQPCYPFYIISDISTHTPLSGNNSTLTPVSKLRSTFQSTLSSLRAIQNGQQHQPSDYFNPRSPHRERPRISVIVVASSNFNPRSPHRERHSFNIISIAHSLISIHAPLTGSDAPLTCSPVPSINFNPCSPHRERRCKHFNKCCRYSGFNPRSPHRERLAWFMSKKTFDGFQSTLPSQGATGDTDYVAFCTRISIHAPLTGSDDCA